MDILRGGWAKRAVGSYSEAFNFRGSWYEIMSSTRGKTSVYGYNSGTLTFGAFCVYTSTVTICHTSVRDERLIFLDVRFSLKHGKRGGTKITLCLIAMSCRIMIFRFVYQKFLELSGSEGFKEAEMYNSWSFTEYHTQDAMNSCYLSFSFFLPYSSLRVQ